MFHFLGQILMQIQMKILIFKSIIQTNHLIWYNQNTSTKTVCFFLFFRKPMQMFYKPPEISFFLSLITFLIKKNKIILNSPCSSSFDKLYWYFPLRQKRCQHVNKSMTFNCMSSNSNRTFHSCALSWLDHSFIYFNNNNKNSSITYASYCRAYRSQDKFFLIQGFILIFFFYLKTIIYMFNSDFAWTNKLVYKLS